MNEIHQDIVLNHATNKGYFEGRPLHLYLKSFQTASPEREKMLRGTYTHALVDSEKLEWIELSAGAKDDDPS